MKYFYFLCFTFLSSFYAHAQFEFEEQVILDEFYLLGGSSNIQMTDIDNDGDLDIVAATSKIVWYKNLDGQGNFDFKPILIGSNAGALFDIVDIDGDGDLDIYGASLSSDNVLWYENTDGQGTYMEHVINSSDFSNTKGLVAKDVDGDNDVDLILATHVSGVFWFENNDGLGSSFQQHEIVVPNGWMNSINAGDFDNDGDIDVVYSTSTTSTSFVWHENLDGNGTFGDDQDISSSSSSNSKIIVIDIDLDGDEDLVSIFLNDIVKYINTDGVFGSRQIIVDNTNNTNFSFEDLDNDGDKDIMMVDTVSNPDRLLWYANEDGVGGFSAVEQIISMNVISPNNISAGDVDNDGDNDIVGACSIKDEIAWYENIDALGSFDSEQIISVSVDGSGRPEASDIDGDGDLDLISTSFEDSKISWYENIDGLGTFGRQNIIDVVYGPGSAKTADLDGDGDLDIYCLSRFNHQFNWYENLDGQGTFGPRILMATENFPGYMNAGDLDGDGDLDIMTTSNEGFLSWYENDGLGNFGARQYIESVLFSANGQVSSKDIDGDGDNDVVVGGQIMRWYENLDGMGSFSNGNVIVDAAGGGSFFNITLVDIDNDGDLDVMSAVNLDNKISLFKNLDGLGGFGSEQIISNSTNDDTQVLSFADIDQDGDLDLLTSSQLNNEIYWYENIDGLGNFNSEQMIINTESSRIVNTADIDDDGKIDLMATGMYSIAWFKNDGNLSVDEFELMNVLIYPNPTKSLLNIESKYTINSLEVFNLLGQTIFEKTTSTLAEEIDMSGFNSGIYLVKVEISGESVTYRIIKE